jgi:hypothetical protein
MEIVELIALASKFNVESRLGSSPPKDESDNPNKPPTFTYRELATATRNFREESFIGEGGFGLVYKGKLESTGQVNHLLSFLYWTSFSYKSDHILFFPFGLHIHMCFHGLFIYLT